MKLITRKMPANHNIFLAGDLHEGSVLSFKKGWMKMCDMLHSSYDGVPQENNYMIHMGDFIEAIKVDDKRFSPEKLTEDLPLVQIEEAIKSCQDIAHKMLFALQGNHELKLWTFGNITQTICNRLGISYGTYSAKLTVLDEKEQLMYKLSTTHGSKNISSTADSVKRRRENMELILQRHLKFKWGDCIGMFKAHCHKVLVCPPEPQLFLTDDGKKIKQNYTPWFLGDDGKRLIENYGKYIDPNDRWYGATGSFLRLYGRNISGYAEIKEYDPIDLGFLIWKVRNNHIAGVDPVILKI